MLPIALANHPSYPFAHSCITSAFMTGPSDAFPSGRVLEPIITNAWLSPTYDGMPKGSALGARLPGSLTR